MKNLVKATVLSAAVVVAPMTAAQADNDVGCGIGTQIWEGKKGLGYHILASMTNGMLFNSISLTFGLVNCDGRDTVTASALRRHYVSTSLDALARDTAVGGGESLDTLASLLDLPVSERPAFAAFAQRHFDRLFPSDSVTSDEMLEALDALMREDEHFASYARS